MSCCDSTSTTVNGCCSIHGTLASGLGVRWDSTGASGPSAGVEIPVYQADSISPSAITITSGQRLWVAWVQLIVATSGDSIIYRGTAAGDYTQANKVIAGGPVSDNGGVIATLPWVRLAAGDRLWAKTATDDAFRVIGYGILETIVS